MKEQNEKIREDGLKVLLKSVEAELLYRLKWCANLYGSKWKDEEKFLKGCKAAFDELHKREEHEMWRVLPNKVPDEREIVILTVANEHPAADIKKEVRCAIYMDGEFTIDGDGEGEFVPMAWKPAPNPWEAE